MTPRRDHDCGLHQKRTAGLDYAHYDFNYRFGFGTAPALNLVTRNDGQQPIIAAPLGPRTAQRQDQGAMREIG